MNYIYDIYLNLNENLYDFFDWNRNDKIIHIKKMPIIKTSEENIKKLIQSRIIIDNNLLVTIYKKSESWEKTERLDYTSLFTDGNNIICIQFNDKGISERKSFLLIDEELEILDTVFRISETKFDFKVIKKEPVLFKTRKQVYEEDFVIKELKNIEDKKLNYIYFECFGKREKNKRTMINELQDISKNSKVYKNLYDILKLTSKTK